MKFQSAVVGGLAGLLMLGGCNTSTAHSDAPRSSGSLALSNDDQTLFAADTDNGVVSVVDVKSREKRYEVKVGVRPFRLAIGKDDTLYVANRGSRTVSVIRAGDQTESAQIATGVDPVGLAVSPDGKTLYIVSATATDTADYGTLTAVDTATLQPTFELDVGNEPRGIALLDHGKRAVISLYRDGDLVDVDLTTQTVKHGTDLYATANRAAVTSTVETVGSTASYHPRAMTDVIASPLGDRVYVTALWDREAPLGVLPTPGAGYYANGGPCSAGAIASAGIVTLDTSGPNLTAKADDVSSCFGTLNTDTDYPASTEGISAFGGGTPVQGPTVGVVDPLGDWLFVVNKESHNLSVLSARRRQAREVDTSAGYYGGAPSPGNVSVHSVAAIRGAGPDGLALTADGARSFTYSQFDHQIEEFGLNADHSAVVNKGSPIKVAQDVLPLDQVFGRKLFFDATDPHMSSTAATVACSTCHLEGRDDAQVWKFPDGPRQTPSLAGRGTLDTKPYHWSGEFATLQDFLNHTISLRMGGSGLDATSSANLDAFLGAIPAPENANQKPELTPAQAHGSQLFQSAGCNSCHAGQWLTNNKNENVGTLVLGAVGTFQDNGQVVEKGLNVPSLKGLARSAPYLHDGSASSLTDRLKNNPGDKHGTTNNLSDSDIGDLVAYLKTL